MRICSPNKRDRGLPPPPTFDLYAMPDSADLLQVEVAQWLRETVSYTERKRREGTDGLTWHVVNGRPRCKVGILKKRIAEVTLNSNVAPLRGSKPAPAARPKIKTKRPADAREERV